MYIYIFVYINETHGTVEYATIVESYKCEVESDVAAGSARFLPRVARPICALARSSLYSTSFNSLAAIVRICGHHSTKRTMPMSAYADSDLENSRCPSDVSDTKLCLRTLTHTHTLTEQLSRCFIFHCSGSSQ